MNSEIIRRNDRSDLNIDLFAPDGAGNGAAVVLVHGGAWMFGDRSAMHEYCKRLAAKGYLAIAAQYGLLPAARWPEPLDDVRDVVRWTKAEAARLNIDPTKVALMGFSAGGHLAMLAAGTGNGAGDPSAVGDGRGADVAAMIACFGPPVIAADKAGPGSPLELLLGGGGEQKAHAISPLTYAGPDFPSTLLMVGNADVLTTAEEVLVMYKALEAAGTNPELHIYCRQNHEFTALPSMIDAFIDEVAFFLRRTVVEPQHFLDEDKALNIFSQPGGLAAALAGSPPA